MLLIELIAIFKPVQVYR